MSTITEDYVLAPQKKCQKIAGGVSAMTWSRWEQSGSDEPVEAADLDAPGETAQTDEPDGSEKPKFPTAYVINGRKYYSLADLYPWLEAHKGKPTNEIPDAEVGRIKGRAALSVRTSNV